MAGWGPCLRYVFPWLCLEPARHVVHSRSTLVEEMDEQVPRVHERHRKRLAGTIPFKWPKRSFWKIHIIYWLHLAEHCIQVPGRITLCPVRVQVGDKCQGSHPLSLPPTVSSAHASICLSTKPWSESMWTHGHTIPRKYQRKMFNVSLPITDKCHHGR